MRKAILRLVLWMALFTLVGCNTWAGLGKDVQKVGRKMEDAGERHR